MEYLLSRDEMKEADTFTSRVIGIPSLVLMERAALALADAVEDHIKNGSVLVYAGSGNNGADGIAAGRILCERGYDVRIIKTFDRCPGDSVLYRQLHAAEFYQIPIEHIREDTGKRMEADGTPGIVIDAVFGTGLSGQASGDSLLAIRRINALHTEKSFFVCSADMPSGISADTGKILGEAVRADITVTFGFRKRGQFLFPGTVFCGKCIVASIGITSRSLTEEPLWHTRLPSERLQLALRDESGNKGTCGKVLIAAGSKGMCGAACMCGEACARTGAGMIRFFSPEENRIILQELFPEAMLTCFETQEEMENHAKEAVAWADVLVIGPGMGRSVRSGQTLQALLQAVLEENSGNRNIHGRKRMVLDADALFLLGKSKKLYDLFRACSRMADGILTPHPGELAGLVHKETGDVLENHLKYARMLADDLGCTVIAKDARSYVVQAGRRTVYLNSTGDSSLATAGSGDILAGMAAAFLHNEKSVWEAAWKASYLLGIAGEAAGRRLSRRSVLARDILYEIPSLLV